jgi:hypothetical protein
VKYVVLGSGVRFLPNGGADNSNGDRSQLMWFGYLLFVSACEGVVCLVCMCGVIRIFDVAVSSGVALRASVHRTAIAIMLSESFKCLALLIFPYELCSRHATEYPVRIIDQGRAANEFEELNNFVGLTVLLANTSAFCVLLHPVSDQKVVGLSTSTIILVAVLMVVEVLSRLSCRYFCFGFDKDDLLRLGLL